MTPAQLHALDSDRCPTCGFHRPTQGDACDGTLKFALAAKSAGQSRATAVHPSEAAAVDAAIRQLAATGKSFSANDARVIHGVTGGVVGARFTALRKAGVIRPVGDETSSSTATHGHRIFRWQGVAA